MSRIGGADSGLRSHAAREVPSGVEYHHVLAGEERRICRGILAILLLLGGLLAFTISLTGIASLIDRRPGAAGPVPGGSTYRPLFHAAAMASIALLIPWSMVIQRRLYGVRDASLHSVVSRFRWDLFGRAAVLIGAAWVASAVVGFYLQPLRLTVWSSADVMWLLATTFLLTPLQGAGEEYGFRGLVFRVAAGWGRGPRTALFAFLVAVALRNDLAPTSDRAAGAADASVLVSCVVVAAVAAVVWFRTRRSGPARTPSPAAAPRGAGSVTYQGAST